MSMPHDHDPEGPLERCTARVDYEGNLTITYKWTNLKVEGSMSHDEYVGDWSDDDIVGLVGDLIGCSDEDCEKIKVEWE